MTEFINIKLGHELHQKLRLEAAYQGTQIKVVTINAIKEYLENKQKKRDK